MPKPARIGLQGITPWQTANSSFYRIDTAIVVPAIEPTEWSLRIHGKVDREITLTFADLVARELTEAWVTLCCVSNEVGGDLIGNAWFSGVRLADILAEAGPHADADAVLQTSDDGWNCGTPLAVLTDDRNAMLAIAMNGEPAAARARLPGPDGRAGAVRLRLGVQVGGRHGGHQVRRDLGVLDRAGLERGGAGEDRVAHRRAAFGRRTCRPEP